MMGSIRSCGLLRIFTYYTNYGLFYVNFRLGFKRAPQGIEIGGKLLGKYEETAISYSSHKPKILIKIKKHSPESTPHQS